MPKKRAKGGKNKGDAEADFGPAGTEQLKDDLDEGNKKGKGR